MANQKTNAVAAKETITEKTAKKSEKIVAATAAEKTVAKAATPVAEVKAADTEKKAKEAVNKTEVKEVKAETAAASAPAPAEKKAPQRRGRKPGPKTKAAESKASAKRGRKPAAKKEEAVQEVYFEYNSEQILAEGIVARIKEEYKNEGHRVSSIKTLRVYINPDERKAYYVINDKAEGKFVEF